MASILVVEDDFNMRLLITTILKMAHHEVLSTENGRDAVEHLQESCRFDLIISDILMPEMNGLELLDWARQLCPSTPIMMFTVHARHDWIQEALQKGAVCYLLKPFTKEQLIMAIEDILNSNPLSNDSGRPINAFWVGKVLAPIGSLLKGKRGRDLLSLLNPHQSQGDYAPVKPELMEEKCYAAKTDPSHAG